jgi:hypothetical protein
MAGGDDFGDDGGSTRYLKDHSPPIQLPSPNFEKLSTTRKKLYDWNGNYGIEGQGSLGIRLLDVGGLVRGDRAHCSADIYKT